MAGFRRLETHKEADFPRFRPFFWRAKARVGRGLRGPIATFNPQAGLIWALFLLKIQLGDGDLLVAQGLDEARRVRERLLEGLERRKPSEGLPRVAVHLGE